MPELAPEYSDLRVPIPVRHRRKVPFRPRLRLNEGFARRLAHIHELDRALSRYLVAPEAFRDRTVEVVSSNLFYSVRLEGNPLELDQVRQVTRDSLRGQVRARSSPPSREVLNHLAVWLLPDQLEGTWTLGTVLGLHRELLTGVDPTANPGALRRGPSAIYSDQDEEVFRTAPPEHVAEELAALLDWLHHEGAALDPLVAGTLFFHEFESIHPFDEGNGRTGRVLFHAYLQHHGLRNAYRARLEVEILREPETYYRVLSWTDHTGDYSVLIDYFGAAVERAYEEAVDWYQTHDRLRDLEPLARLLVTKAFERAAAFDLRTAHGWVPNRSEQTVRLRLRELARRGLLVEEGRTRAHRYRFADPLSEIHERLRPLRQALGLPVRSIAGPEGPHERPRRGSGRARTPRRHRSSRSGSA